MECLQALYPMILKQHSICVKEIKFNS
uniref:Uncharacterized protein n=1 Tax=Arundo donax TaxID=35708 RepID=A0A0A8Z6T9_ARUDO